MLGPRERGPRESRGRAGRAGDTRSAQNAGRTRADPNLLGAPPGGWAHSLELGPAAQRRGSPGASVHAGRDAAGRVRPSAPPQPPGPQRAPAAFPGSLFSLTRQVSAPSRQHPTVLAPLPFSCFCPAEPGLSFKAQGSRRLLRGLPLPSRSAQAWRARERW